MSTEAHFHDEVRRGVDRLKREIAYNPTYFNRMVGEYGPVEATRRLIVADAVSDGFNRLWEHRRLNMSVEALAILPWYSTLFDAAVIARAKHRLTEYGFDVESYLASLTADPPTWWKQERPG